MSNFPFIQNQILRFNLDVSFMHIVDLLTISESESYRGKNTLVSSLRKTIIIHTASIIEALLLWKFKQVCNTAKVELADEWKYFDIKPIYRVNESQEVIAGLRRKEQKDVDKIEFARVTELCQKYNILRSEKLKTDIDAVRELRNRMHIGGLSEIEKEYRKIDLEFCFDVTRRVKKLVSN